MFPRVTDILPILANITVHLHKCSTCCISTNATHVKLLSMALSPHSDALLLRRYADELTAGREITTLHRNTHNRGENVIDARMKTVFRNTQQGKSETLTISCMPFRLNSA